MADKLYILYDYRATSGDTSQAAVLTTAESLKEVKVDSRDWSKDCVWFVYDDDGKTLTNEIYFGTVEQVLKK